MILSEALASFEEVLSSGQRLCGLPQSPHHSGLMQVLVDLCQLAEQIRLALGQQRGRVTEYLKMIFPLFDEYVDLLTKVAERDDLDETERVAVKGYQDRMQRRTNLILSSINKRRVWHKELSQIQREILV